MQKLLFKGIRDERDHLSRRRGAGGGYTARALGAAIFTEADTLDAFHDQVQDAVRCHFN